MSKVKKILIVLLLALPFLLSTGLASWIIINVKEDESPPNYNYETIVENAFKDQQKEYDHGEEVLPSAKYEGTLENGAGIDDIIDTNNFKWQYSTDNGASWKEGKPTDAGKYLLRIYNEIIGAEKGVVVSFEIIKTNQVVDYKEIYSFEYDGQEHSVDINAINVIYGLKDKLNLVNNDGLTDVGSKLVTIEIKGNSNYNDFSKQVTLEVYEKNISSADVEAVVVTPYTYTGSALEPSYGNIQITYNNMILDSDDYNILSWSNNINATKDTKASVLIEGKGNYAGQRVLEFDIAKANQVVSFSNSKTYDGSPANVTATTNREVEDANPTKKITYYDLDKKEIDAPTEVGEYYVRVQISGTDNYNDYDSDYTLFTINPLSIMDTEIGVIDDIAYTKNPITLPIPSIKFNDKDLKMGEDADYTISYKDSSGNVVTEIVDAGTYYAVITGHNNFTGSYDVKFNVVKDAIGDCSIVIPNLTYTGSELTPSVTITDNGVKLIENEHYTLSYGTIIDANTYNITITGAGLYEGKVTKSVNVDPANINDVTVTGVENLFYTGLLISIYPKLEFNSIELTDGKDYTYKVYRNGSVSEILEQGKYTLLITAEDGSNFEGTKEVTFTVDQLDISNLDITTNETTYNGENQVPTVTVKYGETVISSDNYNVTYSYTEFIDAGTYTLTITTSGNLTGTTTVDYIIDKLDIKEVTAEYNKQEYYVNSQITPDITLTYKGYPLTSADYKVTYGENIEVGQGSITVTALDDSNYTGSATYYFNIIKESLDNVEITGYEETIKYTGAQYTPEVVVKLNGITLTKGTEYTVEYGTNVNAGTTTYIKVIGTGIYSGEKEVIIEIEKADITGIIFKDKEVQYNGETHSITIENEALLPTGVTVAYYLGEEVFNGAMTVNTYTITARFTVNNSNYNDLADMTATLEIYKAEYDMSNIIFTPNSIEYDGQIHKLEVSGKLPAGVTVEYYVNDEEFMGTKDQGTYTIIAKFTGDTDNYELIDDMSATLTITKATPVITITNAIYSIDYNSSLGLSSNYSITNNPDGITEVITITNSDGVDVTEELILNAGTYTVTITINGNSNVNTVFNTFTLQINKIDPAYTVPTGLTGIYGKELSSITLPEGWSFVSPTDVMNNTGDYTTTIKYTPSDVVNYNVITKDVVIDVQKATISGISFNNKEYTYNGSTYNITISGTLPTGVTVDYYYENELFEGAIKVGEYEIVAKFTDTTGNYEAIADMKAKLTIKKAAYDMTGISFVDKEVDYNGTPQTIAIIGNLPKDLNVEYYIGTDKFTNATNAGTYTVTAKFSDTSDGGDNYILPADLTATLTINQIMDPNYAEQGNLTASYGQTLEDIASGLLSGWSFVDELTTLVGDAGENTFEVVFTPSDETNYKTITKEIKVIVGSINPTFTVEDNTYVFDGTSHKATVTSVSTGTLTVVYKLNGETVENPTNAGNYDIYVTITGTNNYNALNDYKLEDQLVISKYEVTNTNSQISAISDQEYTGTKVEPSVIVTLIENIPFDSNCYQVTYSNNIERGEATVTITLTGNFKGTLTTTFNIVQGAITGASITPIENRPYTGRETVYELIVTVNGKELTIGEDYTVSVEGNTTNAGKVTITVTGTGNYSGTGTVSFEITQVSIDTCKDIIVADQVYLTEGNKPLPTVEIEGLGTLINGTDYTLSYSNNVGVTNAAKVIITGTGNYTGSKEVTFTITPKDISDIDVQLKQSIIYTGNAIEPITLVTLTGYDDLTYSIEYSNNTNSGTNTASYTIKGTGNFTGTVTKQFTINPFDLSTLTDEEIELIGSLVYTSKQIKPTVEVSFNNDILSETNYTLTYGNNINVVDGGSVTINAESSNFTGNIIINFVIEARTISDAIASVSDQAYTGNALTPIPTVTIDGIGTLTNNVDFELSYSDNKTDVSDSPVTITIKGIGNYTGNAETSFNITPIDITGATVAKIADVYYSGNAIEPTPVITVIGFGTLSAETDYDVTYRNNTSVGVATITITAKGNFTGTVTTTFNIIDSIASATVYFGELTQPADQVYTGTEYTPEVTKVVINGVTLTLNTHYEVTYGENTTAGTGHVYITAVDGSGYEGVKDIEFNIAKATQTINYKDINEIYSGNTFTITATSSIDSAITYLDEEGNTFTGATDAGTYKVTIVAAGNVNYKEAKVTATITITPFNIANLVVGTNITGFQDKVVYTGDPIVQDLAVKFNGLSINDQLTIIQNNQNPTTTAKIIISVNEGVTNFTGTKELTYTIDKAEQVITVEKESITAVYGNDYEIKYTKLGDGVVTIFYYNGEQLLGEEKPTEVGNYRAVIHVAEGTCHYAGTKEVTITIIGINPTITIDKYEYDYDGEAKAIEYTTNSSGKVTIVYKDANGVVVDEPTKVGVYTVSITQAAAGNYLERTVTGSLIINAILPVITVSNLVDNKMTFDYLESYDIVDYITITNNPDGLQPTITYNGLSTAPTVPGSYSVVITIAATDNTLESIANFTLVINTIDAEYKGQKEFTATYGDKLSSIELPSGLTWNNPDDLVGNATTTGNVHNATYNPDESLYNPISVQITVIVNKATITKPTENSTTFTYDTKEQTYEPTGFDSTTMTIDGNKQTNAGSYEVTVSISDKANYTWSDGTSEDIKFTFTIDKANPEYTLPKDLTGEFGTTLSTVELSEGWSWDKPNTVLNTLNENLYDATYTVNDNNYNDIKIKLTVTVVQGSLENAIITGYETSVEYSTTLYQPSLIVTHNNKVLTEGTDYEVDYGTLTTAGNKQVITITGKGNYGLSQTIEITITKAKLEKPEAISTEFTYTGSAQTYTPSGYDSNTMSISGNVQTAAGTHTVTVSLKDTNNYEWSDGSVTPLTYDFVIRSLSIDDSKVTVSELTNMSYTGEQLTQDFTVAFNNNPLRVNTDYTYSYAYNNDNFGTVTITITGKGNFTGTRTVTFEIVQAEQTIDVSGMNTTLTYNTKEQSIGTATAKTSLTYLHNGSEISTVKTVGTYEITIEAAATKYYKAATTIVTVVVKKLLLDKPTADTDEFTYTTGSLEYIPEGYNSSIMNISGNVQTNAGSYPVIVSLKDTTNYGWKDGTEEGSIENITFTFVIEKAKLTKPTASTTAITYSGNEQTYTPTGYDSNTMNISGNTGTEATDYTATVTLKDHINYMWSDGTDGEVTVEFTINPFDLKDLADSAVTLTGDLTYTGSQIKPTVAVTFNNSALGTTLYSVEYGTNVTVAEGGTVTITANSANFTGSKVVIFNITAKSINGGTVTFDTANMYYTGSNITPINGVTLAGYTGITYSVEYENNINAGTNTASYVLTGNGNYTGTITGTFSILKADPTYKGSTTIETTYAIDQTLASLTLPDSNLRWDDSTLIVGNATAEGHTFKAYYNPDNNNYNDKEVTITVIVNKVDLSTLSLVGYSCNYDGNVKSLSLSQVLPEDLDVSFTNNDHIDSGIYTVFATITGSIENYKLPTSLQATLQINRISPTVSDFEDMQVALNKGYTIDPIVKGLDGNNINYIINYYDSENNLLDSAPTKIGSYKVTLLVDETNYVIEKSITLSIINPIKVVVSGVEVDYDGNEHPATVVVFDSENNDITSAVISVLSISYIKDNTSYSVPKNAGEYSVTVSLTDLENYTLISDSVTTTTIKINKLTVSIDFDDYDDTINDCRMKYAEYTGDAISFGFTITGISSELISSDFKLKIQTTSGTDVDPSNVIGIGSYNFIVEYNIENYNLLGYNVGRLEINKIKIKLNNDIFEFNYGDISTFSDIYDSIIPTYIKLSDSKIVDDSTNMTYRLSVINDGVNQYDYSSEKAIGNTYLGYLSIESNIYLLCDSNGNEIDYNTITIKYKTVIVDGEYYTIEDAIRLDSANIILVGNDSAYVMTSFTKIYGNVSYDLSGDTLTIPYDSTGDAYNTEEGTASGSVYSVLYIPEGITLNAINNSSIIVSALIGYGQPNTTIVRNRGVILNDGTINIGSSVSTDNYLYSYGYIKSSKNSNGSIRIYNGSTAVDCMRTYDWPGGNTSTKIYEEVLPMNAWSVHNISCPVRIDGGATYKTFFYAVASIEVSPTINVITGNQNESCLFAALDTNSYVIKYATPSRNSPTDSALYDITGSNQVKGQKDIIELYGNFVDSVLQIDIGVGDGIKTSTEVACPLGYVDVIIKSSDKMQSTLTLSKSDYLFLPGTSVTIEDGATLNVSSGVDLSFETVNNINKVSDTQYAFRRHFVDTNVGDARLYLSGILNCSGNIGGLVIPLREGVTLNLANCNINTSFYSLYSAVGASATRAAPVAYKVSSFPVSGYITSDNMIIPENRTAFNKLVYNSVEINGQYYWLGDPGASSVDGELDDNGKSISGCLAEGTLITMADGTKKKVEEIVAGDLLLVFNHETGKYNVAEVLFNDSENINNYTVINLKFSNNSLVRVVSEHGFFDLDLMKYVYIDEFNYKDYIGHRFISSKVVDGEVIQSTVTLDEAYITEEYIRIYSPVTNYHLNYITEDMLSMPGGIKGLFNIFEYDINLQYKQDSMQKDIEEYGLFTYEDFKDLVSYDVYCSLPAQYFKVAIGKGILTWEDLYYYIERYAPLM